MKDTNSTDTDLFAHDTDDCNEGNHRRKYRLSRAPVQVFVTDHARDRYTLRFRPLPPSEIIRVLQRSYRASRFIGYDHNHHEIRQCGPMKLIVRHHQTSVIIITVTPYERNKPMRDHLPD